MTGIETKFEFAPRNYTFYRGKRFVRISCRPPKASPAPEIKWLWNGRIINPSTIPNFATVNYNDPLGLLYHALEIRKPSSGLAGNYSCVASNVGGRRFSKFTFTEIRKSNDVITLINWPFCLLSSSIFGSERNFLPSLFYFVCGKHTTKNLANIYYCFIKILYWISI